MALYYFSEIGNSHTSLGGKAYHLARLAQLGLPVPPGIILTSLPESKETWEKIYAWWKDIDHPRLAVRSSASDEDHGDVSFAGQNSSYLNISSKEGLEQAIEKCFNSINNPSSLAYRQYFHQEKNNAHMNVLIQQMIGPKFAGVYFSKDPRGTRQGDLIEYITGTGEDLVGGKKTPYKIQNGVADHKKAHEKWREKDTLSIRSMGQMVAQKLNFPVDMEWAISHDHTPWLLQARPITTGAGLLEKNHIVAAEMDRLKNEFSANTHWDGQTFAEWTGVPSTLTYSLYEGAFSPHMAFGKALKKLGYLGFEDVKKRAKKKTKTKTKTKKDSILNKVFGRAYINLDQLIPIYFGDIPYTLIPKPRPHLQFSWKKITLKGFLKTPFSIFKMMQVGWNLSAKRTYWLNLCRKNLATFKDKMDRPLEPELYRDWGDEALLKRFAKECHIFSRFTLIWPFVLVTLTEATLSSLKAILKNVLGEKEAKMALDKWMSSGLNTATYEMNRYFKRAQAEVQKRPFFISRYGHRGAGELELSNPRWIELSEKYLFGTAATSEQKKLMEHRTVDLVAEEINTFKTFKKTIILQEWKLLRGMLKLREKWKMELLKPFAHIRFLTLEIARRNGLGNDIFHLNHHEIVEHELVAKKQVTKKIIDLIEKRKEKAKIFKLFSFPLIVSRGQIEKIIKGENSFEKGRSLDGVSLSPGIAYGTVRVIRDINLYDTSLIKENDILVAETTDPGWTPYFSKAAGLIVEKGGILSHAAIVAREMGIPAISGISNCLHTFNDGDRICLDANNGNINYE